MSNYFSQLPDFEYVSRLPDSRISDYIPVKNLFKKGKLREDIIEQTAVFTKYKIKGDDRPDNVAQELYGDPDLDWVILASNNILNVYDEWPMTQRNFENYLLEKYGTYEQMNAVHHYETTEVKDSLGKLILPAGKVVDSSFIISYYDDGSYYTNDSNILGLNVVNISNPIIGITNYEYESKKNDEKSSIYLLKQSYLQQFLNDMRSIMLYGRSSEYISDKLIRTENTKTVNPQ